MSFDAQVAVIGGGVAGAAACCSLARQGLQVVWVKPERPQDHVFVGESLAPTATAFMQQLGLSHLLNHCAHRPANTRYSAWGRSVLVENHAMTSVQGAGHVLDRALFESQMNDHAVRCARCVCATLVSAQRRPGAYVLQLSNGLELCAPWVVDATGRAAVVGRSRTSLERADQLIGVVGFPTRVHTDVQATQATLVEAVNDGWWYAALLASQRMVLVYFSDPDLLPQGLSHRPAPWQQAVASTQYVSRWLNEAGFVPHPLPTLHSAGTTWLRQPAVDHADGSGWLAVGDAAFAMDPLSSHGLTTALWGGLRAGQVVASHLAGGISELSLYVTQLIEGRSRYLLQRRAMYGAERRFSRAPFWQRRHAFSRAQN